MVICRGASGLTVSHQNAQTKTSRTVTGIVAAPVTVVHYQSINDSARVCGQEVADQVLGEGAELIQTSLCNIQ